MSTWMTRDGRPIEVRPARGAFDDFAAVVGPKTPGTPGCWCMAYRDARKGLDDRIAHMKSECATEPGPGVLAYIEGVVAGWCSVAPRYSYRRLMNSRTIPNLQKLEIDERDPWAIVCFVVRAGYRKKGVARALLGGAIEHVRAHGGGVLEGYPVSDEEGRVDTISGYVGGTSLFEQAGFTRVMLTDSHLAHRDRWLMRLEV